MEATGTQTKFFSFPTKRTNKNQALKNKNTIQGRIEKPPNNKNEIRMKKSQGKKYSNKITKKKFFVQ